MTALIPVVDLLRGQAVRAVRGDRRTYQPVVSTLCAGSDPLTVAGALLAASRASRLYVADLDALQGGAVQVDVVRRLLEGLPAATELWIDAGFADAAAAMALNRALGPAATQRVVSVYASEALGSAQALAEAVGPAAVGALNVALSLDRRDGRRLDAAGCWDSPALWPQRVIVMTLERVGSGAGPDLETVLDVKRRAAPGTLTIGAGGLRDAADLARAAAAGIDAWLVASALHDATLQPSGG